MPYLNSVVFYHGFDRKRFEFTSLPPRNMADALRRGLLDAGPLPLAEILRMGDSVVPISDFGVATDGRARSVILASDRPVDDLGGCSVAVTAQTSTSVQLLRILFDKHWGVEDVALEGPEAEAQASLLIGDDALAEVYGAPNHNRASRHVYDLSLEWKKLTGYPFVFARWVARSELDAGSYSEFEKALTESYEAGIGAIDSIAESPPVLGMSETQVVEYIRGFTYRLGKREEVAIVRFEQLLSELPKWLPPVYGLGAMGAHMQEAVR